MLEKIEERIKELTKKIEESVLNHNAIVGAWKEANDMLALAKEVEPALAGLVHDVEAVAEIVHPAE